MRIVFMGTPAFAVPSLRRLLEDGHTVPLVVTQADKPAGRGHTLTAPPVKQFAIEQGLQFYQPVTLKDDESFAVLSAAKPELIVVVAYGKLLPARVLALPENGCINVHASLLPKYRGAAPIQWAVMNGERETGVTTQRMAAAMDTGDILLQSKRAIPPDATSGDMFELLAADGAALLSRTLAENPEPIPQDAALATYAPPLTKALCPLDFSHPAAELHNRVRGLAPFLTAICQYGEEIWKVWETRVAGDSAAVMIKPPIIQTVAGSIGAAPAQTVADIKAPASVAQNTSAAAQTDAALPIGAIVNLTPLTVACGGGTALELRVLQAPDKPKRAGEEFARGKRLQIGDRLR